MLFLICFISQLQWQPTKWWVSPPSWWSSPTAWVGACAEKSSDDLRSGACVCLPWKCFVHQPHLWLNTTNTWLDKQTNYPSILFLLVQVLNPREFFQQSEPLFSDLLSYISCSDSPVICMCWQGPQVVKCIFWFKIMISMILVEVYIILKACYEFWNIYYRCEFNFKVT
jgi:hypothetical protein